MENLTLNTFFYSFGMNDTNFLNRMKKVVSNIASIIKIFQSNLRVYFKLYNIVISSIKSNIVTSDFIMSITNFPF